MPHPDGPSQALTVESPLDLVGNTPLIRLRRVAADLPPTVKIYGKAEWYNPGGSVKDRPALNMIESGEQSGALTPDKVILDATSGNTGIAYAWIGAAKGYKVKLALPSNASEERKKILSAYGVDLVLTDPGAGSDGAILKAKEIYAIYFHDDGFEWFDALEKGRLKTIYASGENGKFDHLFFEDDALSKFVSLYKRNEYIR